MKKIYFFLLLMFQSAILFAANYNGEVQKFPQPDGTTVPVKLFGNEDYMRGESLDGYTLISEDGTRWICYAALSADGKKLESTGRHYTSTPGEAASLHLPQHLDIDPAVIEQKINEGLTKRGFGRTTQRGTGRSTAYNLQGNITGIAIIVDFPDFPANTTTAQIDSFLNGANYTANSTNGSMNAFYKDISGGKINYKNKVFGVYHSPKTFKYWNDTLHDVHPLLDAALRWVDNQGFDFSTLSKNSDNSIQAINLLCPEGGAAWGNTMWWHQGGYGDFTADGVKSGKYNLSQCYPNPDLGLVCHENGHMIAGWPDTYQYNAAGGPDGLGNFDLMCASWSHNPPMPNPKFLVDRGWLSTIDVTDFKGTKRDTLSKLYCYKYTDRANPATYYLLKGKKKVGRNAELPHEGLTIWLCNDNGDNQTSNREVVLVHANNDVTNHSGACFGNNTQNRFTYQTIPSSKFPALDFIPPYIYSISVPADIMTYSFGQDELTMSTTPLTTCNSLYMDPGGKSNYADNTDRIQTISAPSGSGSLSVSFLEFSTEAGYDSLWIYDGTTTSAPKIGAFSGSTLPANITSTNASAALTFRFHSDESVNSTGWKAAFTCGTSTIAMSTTAITSTCGSIYLDPGGSGNYANNTDMTQTISAPAGSGSLITTFNEFSLEAGYDSLWVYDGTSTSAPKIGAFSGSTLPANITSTNALAALTFKFHSDGSVNASGWKATLTCGTPAITMSNTPVTAICGITFLDPGGNSNYADNTDRTQTISAPAGSTSLGVTFTEFSLENNYDSLMIYDGTSTAAPRLAKLTGSTLPGTYISTNASAALTFKFHSDVSVNASGWKALLNCNGGAAPVPTQTIVTANEDKLVIYPNPTTGIININLTEEAVISVSTIEGKETGMRRFVQSGLTTLDLSQLPGGIYLIRIQTKNGIKTGKIMLTKN